MDEPIRTAIIGTGDISNRHMKVWDHIPQVTVVAAAEIDPQALQSFGQRYHIPEADLYADFREMLKRDDIDAVDVCVHNNLHAPVSIAVMKAGKDCYCEKPMSASYYDSKLIYDCAKATGRKLAVQLSSLFSAQTLIAKKLIDAGKLGEVYHARVSEVAWRRPGHRRRDPHPEPLHRHVAPGDPLGRVRLRVHVLTPSNGHRGWQSPSSLPVITPWSICETWGEEKEVDRTNN